MELVGHNLEVDGGEIDLVMMDGPVKVAVEVRAVTGEGDPIDAVGAGKRERVRRLAARAGISRVDCVGIGFRSWGVEVHWLPG